MTRERQAALDHLRHCQAVLGALRAEGFNFRPSVFMDAALRDVLNALDAYWGVISREEACADDSEGVGHNTRWLLWFRDELHTAARAPR